MDPGPTALNAEEAIAARTPSRVRADADEKQALHGRPGANPDDPRVSADEVSEDAAPEPEFKEGGYGWVVVFAVFLLNAHTWGLNSSYAVFLAYLLRTDSISGGSPIAYAFVGGLSVSIAFLISPLATILIRRHGTRASLLVGIFFETTAFVGASFTSQMWHLLLSQGISFGVGMGFIFVASVNIVPQWFVRRRSFANAISTAGSGFGGLVYSLGTNAMIKNISFAWAFRIIAIVSCVVNLISTLIVRDRNKSVGAVHNAFTVALLRRPEYLLLVFWGIFSLIAYTIVVFSLPDYAQTVGRTASQASLVGALFNLSQGIGRLIIGLVSDRVGRINIASLGTLIAGITSLLIWTPAGKAYGGLIVYSLLGSFCGILWATVAPVAAEVVGIPTLPSALSVFWLLLALPATFAEVIGLTLRHNGPDRYLPVQLFVGFCFIAAFLCGWLVRAWKLHQLQDMHLSGEQREREIRDGAAYEQDERDKTPFSSYLLTGKWIFAIQRV